MACNQIYRLNILLQNLYKRVGLRGKYLIEKCENATIFSKH
jgi:hypothetical protein